jgi:hypothetical protein
MFDETNYLKPKHPRSTTVLILGITSLVLLVMNACCGLAVFASLTLGIIAIVLGKRAKDEVNANYQAYHPDSLKEIEAGRIMGIITTVLSGVWLVILICLMLIYGAAILFSSFAQQAN